MEYLTVTIGLGFVLLLIGAYIIATIVNNKTKAPAGCELAHLEASCGACLNKTCEIKNKEKVVLWT